MIIFHPIQLDEITITVGDVVLNAVLFDNKTAKDFEKMLPLTISTWNDMSNFVVVFDLPSHIKLYDDELANNEYELGNLVYWPDGPSVEIIYEVGHEQKLVPMVPFGKITDDVSVFRITAEK